MESNVQKNPLAMARWELRLVSVIFIAAICFGLLPPGLNWSDSVQGDAELMQGSLAFQLQWAAVFMASAYVVFRHKLTAMVLIRHINPFLFIIFFYAILSSMWSPLPLVTLKRSIQILGLIVLNLAIYTSQKPWQIHILTALVATTGIEIASVISALAFPGQGMDPTFVNAWRGILSEKNTLGAVGSLSLLLWVSVYKYQATKKSFFIFGILLSLLCIIKSTSSTSITVAALGVGIFWALHKKHVASKLWLLRVVVFLLIIFIVFIQVFFINEARLPAGSEFFGPFASLFGKSSDLTGRTDIWMALIPVIEEHWLWGIGYGAFWFGLGSAAQPVLEKLTWIPYQAHNGYLDYLNELGFFGGFLFLGMQIFNFRKLIELAHFDRMASALFSGLMAILLFSNYTETTMFKGVVFQFNLMIFASVSPTCILWYYRNRRGYFSENFNKNE